MPNLRTSLFQNCLLHLYQTVNHTFNAVHTRTLIVYLTALHYSYHTPFGGPLEGEGTQGVERTSGISEIRSGDAYGLRQ